ncbi:MAG: Tad domain-containing protein [Actinobacteria bacterium]|nr:Tad domain-containing protein [Actinomycetota bacterium]
MTGAAPSRGGEGGSITLWMLGLCVVVLFLGGINLDLWRVFTARRDLAGWVDGAAVAGASAIDVDVYRATATARLDPAAAEERACRYLATHADPFPGCGGVRATASVIEVAASRQVDLTLMRILMPGQPPLTIDVAAHVEPRRS